MIELGGDRGDEGVSVIDIRDDDEERKGEHGDGVFLFRLPILVSFIPHVCLVVYFATKFEVGDVLGGRDGAALFPPG